MTDKKPARRGGGTPNRAQMTAAANYWHDEGISALPDDDSMVAVSRSTPLPVSDARPPATDALYATSGTGAAQSLPGNTYMVELTAVGGDVWFRFGSNAVTAATPSSSAPSGVSRYLPQGASILVDTRSVTHYAVSGGSYNLAWWVA